MNFGHFARDSYLSASGEKETANRVLVTQRLKPKFSSWVKEVLCQVVDVDPITVFGNFDNG